MNKALLIGRLVTDVASYSTTTNGTKFVRFKLAVRRPYKNKDKTKDNSDFIPVIAWSTQADFIEKYLKKGDKISVEGHISISTYTNKQQEIVTRYEVTADRVEALESKAQREARNLSKTEELTMDKVSITKDLTFEEENLPQEEINNDVPWDLELDVDL